MTSSENHVKIGLKTDVSIQSFRILSSKNYVLHALKLLTYILKVFFSFFSNIRIVILYLRPSHNGVKFVSNERKAQINDIFQDKKNIKRLILSFIGLLKKS